MMKLKEIEPKIYGQQVALYIGITYISLNKFNWTLFNITRSIITKGNVSINEKQTNEQIWSQIAKEINVTLKS